MAKQPGPKTLLIREAIKAHPDIGNTDLAERLNNSPTREKDKIKVTAQDVAAQKQALKKQAADGPEEEAEEPEAAATVSKADAVRAALAEGIDSPDEGVAFILKKFGIEMGKPMWSSYRSQEKARQAKKAGEPTPAKPTLHVPAPAASAVSPDVIPALEAIKALCDTLGVDQVKRIAEIFRK